MFKLSTLREPEMNAPLRAVLAGIRDHEDIEAAFDAVDGGDHLADCLGGYDGLMLSAPGPDRPVVLLQLLDGLWRFSTPDARLRVIQADGSSKFMRVGDLPSKEALRCSPGAVFLSCDPYSVEDMQFGVDSWAWIGTKKDLAIDETDWVVTSNQIEVSFDLREVNRGFGVSTSAVPGVWLDITCDGESMSTGDIGLTIWSERTGEFWANTWGAAVMYLGCNSNYTPASAIDVFDDALQLLDTEMWGFNYVRSEVLDVMQIAPILRSLALSDPNVTRDDLHDRGVSCTDFAGSIADLLELAEL